MQNIPIRTDDGKKIRSAFIPRDGYKLFSADYSQIELRIMAHLAKDPAMIESFLTGEDIHSSTARRVFNIKDEPSSDQRRAAKAINFGLIYGISAYGLAKQLKIDNVEAKSIIDTYFAKFCDCLLNSLLFKETPIYSMSAIISISLISISV